MAGSATLEKGKAERGVGLASPLGPPPSPPSPPTPPVRPVKAQDPGEDTGYPPAIRWVILVAVMLGTILEVLDTSIVNVSIPQMMGNLGATLNEIGWVSTGYIIANVVFLPLTGWLSAYFGRRRYLTYSIIVFVVASFLCGISHTLNELIIFRVMQGAGGAALLSTAQATLLEVFPRRQVAMVQAIFLVGVVFAPTVGPTVGGWITDNYSWPWIFFVNIPVGIVAAIMVWTFLRDSALQAKPKGRVDILGIGLLAVGLGCFQTVLEKGNEEGWFESNLIIVLTAFAIVGLTSFIVWELKVENPAVNLRILKNSGFTAGSLIGIVLGFGLYGGVFITPVFLQQVQGYSPTASGMILFPSGVATLCVLPFISRLIGKVQPRYLVMAGALFFSVAMLMLSHVTGSTTGDDFKLPLILRGVSMSLLFLPLTIASLAGLPGKDVPSGAGLFNLARQLGGSVGIAYLSTLLDHSSTIHHTQLSDYVNSTNPNAVARINAIQGMLTSKGSSVEAAHAKAIGMLDGVVHQQASILSFDQAFQVIGLSFLLTIPLAFLLRKASGPPAAAADVH